MNLHGMRVETNLGSMGYKASVPLCIAGLFYLKHLHYEY